MSELELAVIIELLDRNGVVVSRHRCSELPVNIGRGYGNHVIVDDPFVAPTHVRIERRDDGVLVARDTDSRNGIHAVSRWSLWQRVTKPSTEIVLTPDTLVRAGHSTFRVRPVGYAVAPERLDKTSHGWEGMRPAIVALALLCVLGLFSAWSADTSTQENLLYQTSVATFVGAMLLWAGAWALLNRLFGGRARFGRHLLIGTALLVASLVTSFVAELLAYAFSLEWLSRYESYLSLALLSIAVYFHVATIMPLSLAFARRFAVALTVLGTATFAMYRYSTEHQLGDSLYMSSLHWPAVRMVAPTSTATFVDATANLKARADARRKDNAGSEEF